MSGWIFGELAWALNRNRAKRTLFLIGLSAVLAVVVYRPLSGIYRWLFWNQLQRAYFETYSQSSGLPATDEMDFRGLVVDAASANRRSMPFLATTTDVIIRDPQNPDLTSEGRLKGGVTARWATYPGIRADAVYWYLRDNIYDGKKPADLTRVPHVLGWLVFGAFLALGIVLDRRDSSKRRKGLHERGPELLKPFDFNLTRNGDGIALRTRNCRDGDIRLRRQDESLHFLIMGDTGSGKSVLITQILDQLQARGDAVIVYDPAREFIPRYFHTDRQDVLLNPLDDRSPYWDPSSELAHADEALTIAKSLFPDKERENHFFTESSRKIFAFLLTFKPTASELIHWMSNPDEIDNRLTGTALAPLIDKNAPPQRSAVLSTLNLVSDALKLLPPQEQTKEKWSARSWASKRKGWIFLSSTPETREPLLPLLSMWIDLLVLRLMAADLKWSREHPVWIVVDEVASLQRLPQLATALTESRKSNVRIILGFQGRSQIEARYGMEAEAMLSQPATKIFLRTSEPRAAKWISDSIGEVTTERMRESVTANVRNMSDSVNYSFNRTTEPLISPAQITGLPSLEGYLKSENAVVRFGFAPDPRASHVVPFTPRIKQRSTSESDPKRIDGKQGQRQIEDPREPRVEKSRATGFRIWE
jgi:hypothetical protein